MGKQPCYLLRNSSERMGIRFWSGLLLSLAMLACFNQTFAGEKPRIVFFISEPEYETEVTLPKFAEEWLDSEQFDIQYIYSSENDPDQFPKLKQLNQADCLVLSVRRRTPSEKQMKIIRRYFKQGKPMVGIRTASHPFSLRKQDPPEGKVDWPNFDVEVLGAHYENHYSNKGGTEVQPSKATAEHPITQFMKGSEGFHSGGTLYRSVDFQEQTEVLLEGVAEDKEGEMVRHPVAWTNHYGKSRIFYTSLGHREDFESPLFNQMLRNAIYWAIEKEAPAGN
ncbi:ThuA domain-containing protein [Planctomycetales bacterium 10988]|nr:ThuA domain-containing protein [Planctomycetales bacterium 10988]